MVEVIDLTSSSPPAASKSRTSTNPTGKRVATNVATEDEFLDTDEDESSEDGEQESLDADEDESSEDGESDEDESSEDGEQEPLEVLVPTLEQLASIFPDRSELYLHLITLPRPLLSTMLMSHLPDPPPQPNRTSRSKSAPAHKPQPKAAGLSSLAHCVYCHKIYDERNNDGGCAIKHWGDFEDEEFTCCGLYVYWESDNPARPPPEVVEPFCYLGPHHDMPVEGNGDKETSWWKDWEDSGDTCEDRNCEEELKRFVGGKKDLKGK